MAWQEVSPKWDNSYFYLDIGLPANMRNERTVMVSQEETNGEIIVRIKKISEEEKLTKQAVELMRVIGPLKKQLEPLEKELEKLEKKLAKLSKEEK